MEVEFPVVAMTHLPAPKVSQSEKDGYLVAAGDALASPRPRRQISLQFVHCLRWLSARGMEGVTIAVPLCMRVPPGVFATLGLCVLVIVWGWWCLWKAS